jgi:predicted RNase H-like nuclease (RuvC/YqgF family)
MTDETATNLVEDDALLSSETEVAPDEFEPNADDLDAEQNTDDEPEDDDSEEVEHDGQKFRIPKAIKPLLMMQADYTRKTQEVAELRKTVEAQRAQGAQLDGELIQSQAKIVAIDERLAEFGRLTEQDWANLEAQDPVQAQTLWRQFSQLKDTRQQAVGELQHKAQQRHLEQQRMSAKQIEEGQAVLARDIKDWSPEKAGKLSDFAVREFGFSPQEIGGIIDPRMVKVLNRLFEADQVLKKQTATIKAVKAQDVRPTPKVGGASAPPRGLDDRLSPEEWTRRRNEQLRKRG